jgi:hypothetical protein
MLRELTRTSPLAHLEQFDADHRRVIVALESLRRHGYHGAGAGARIPVLTRPTRFLVELRRRLAREERGDEPAEPLPAAGDGGDRGSNELELLRPARMDAQALVEITKSREIGVPTFVIGGLLIPLGISLWRLASGTLREWWVALVVGAIGVAVGLLVSWFVLRGAALASRRIRLSVSPPLSALWRTVGSCGNPPQDQSRRFAVVAISLTLGVWIVLPLLVTLSLAT